MTAADTFKQFVQAINAHDVPALAGLMTADHIFIDSLGNRVQGSPSMQAGWRGYFAMCPGYWIRIDRVLGENNLVLAVGEAGGTIDGVAWQIPAAWQAIVGEGQVKEWRVFADNKPVYDILSGRKPLRRVENSPEH